MKVITIKQPFASLIAAGIKEYEFRTWKTKYRGEIFIHAGKGIGCGNTAEHSQQRRATCNQQRVEHIAAHRCHGPNVNEVAPQGINRENRTVHREDLSAALQCGTDHCEIGVEDEDADKNDYKIQHDTL